MSSPPCRRVAESSRHLRGWPSACWFISVCPIGFPPVMMVFSFIFTAYRYLFLYIAVPNFMTYYHWLLSFQSHFFSVLYHLWHVCISSRTYAAAWFSPLLKDSLLGAILTVSGRWFHFSTIRTANEWFLISVRAYWTASPW